MLYLWKLCCNFDSSTKAVDGLAEPKQKNQISHKMKLTLDVQAIINNKAKEYFLQTIDEKEETLSPIVEGINKDERIKYLEKSLDELATKYFFANSSETKATTISIMVRKASQIKQIWNSYLGE